MLTDFNRIYPIEIEINNLKQTYNTRAIFTVSDLHTSTLLIKIKEQGEPFKLTDCVVTALFSCVDSEIYKQDTTVLEAEQGIVGIDLKHDVLQSGTNSLCLKIVSNSTDIMYTPNMTYEVVTTVADGISAGDKLPIIEEVLHDVQQAKIKVEQLEEQIITRLDTMDTDYQEFQSNVVEQFNSLKQTETALTEKVDNKISEINTSTQEKFEEVDNKLAGVDTYVQNKTGELDTRFQEFATDTTNKLDVKVGELKASVDAKISDADARVQVLEGNVANKITEADNRVQTLETNIANKIVDADNRVRTLEFNVANKLKEVDETSKNLVVETNKKADAKMLEVDTNVNAKLTLADTKIGEMETKKTEFDQTVANKITTWQGTVDAKVKEAEDSLGKINLAVDEFNNLVETVTGRLVNDFRYDIATNSLQIVFDSGDIKSVPMVQDIPIASADTVGGIKIGNGLVITEDGTVNVSIVDMVHNHDNLAELNKITDGKVAIWDAKETVEGSQAKVDAAKQEVEQEIQTLNGEVAKKSNIGHTHTKSEITDMFQVENSLESNSIVNAISVAQAKVIDDKVNTKETPQGSQAKADKSLQDAKQYTDTAIQTLVGTAPPVLDTIYEIATAIQENEGVVGKLTGEIAKKSEIGHTHTKSEITDMPNVIDGLDSTSTTDVLSANQGKLLNEKIAAQQDALSKVHVHSNKAELDKVIDGKVAIWDAKETVEGSQAKATKSLQDAKAYTDTKATEVTQDTASKVSEMKQYVDTKIEENVGRETYSTTVTEWTQEGNLFKATIVHRLNSENAIVCCTEKQTKENVLVSFRVIDANSIEIINDANLELNVMIVSGALRKIEPTYGAEIDDRTTVHNKTWSSEKIEQEIGNQQIVVDTLDQLILTGAYTASPSVANINWIWNSDRMGKVMCLMLPEQKDSFVGKTTLDSILNDSVTRNIVLNSVGVMDTAMSQYGVKRKFVEKIDVVIDMLKSDISKDYILSDEYAVRDILNNVDDFNKFFSAFKENENMRFNILNSDYPYLREKMNGNQEVLVYYLNYGNNDNFLVFKQLFEDAEALKQATVRNGLQYSYLEFVFVLQNLKYYKSICETGVLDGYIRTTDSRIHALLWQADNLQSSIFASSSLCDVTFASDYACDKVFASAIAIKELVTSKIAVPKWVKSNTAKTSTQNNNTIQNTTYLTALYTTVENCVKDGKMRLHTQTYQDGVTALDSSTTQANALVLCCLGTYSSSGAYTNLIHKNGKTATRGNTYRPTSVTTSNVNGVSFSNCRFTEDGDGYAAIRVYTVV